MNTDYLVLVNGEHRLPEGYENTIELVTVTNTEGKTYDVETRTYEAFCRLQKDLLQNDGIQAELISAYRTVARQQKTFDNYVTKFGVEYATKYAAKPGHSEHHTGLAIDVGILQDGKIPYTIEDLLRVNHLFRVVHAKLPKYGFILRYPEDKKHITKVGYEPWHFRYIDSPEIAEEITGKGLCLEEYHTKNL